MQTVNVCYVRLGNGTMGAPLAVFDKARTAQVWCAKQNAQRSPNQIAQGAQYIYSTYKVQ